MILHFLYFFLKGYKTLDIPYYYQIGIEKPLERFSQIPFLDAIVNISVLEINFQFLKCKYKQPFQSFKLWKGFC